MTAVHHLQQETAELVLHQLSTPIHTLEAVAVAATTMLVSLSALGRVELAELAEAETVVQV